ncbi:MAG: lipocalin family protein [Prevotella sp.]|nr:lipocalin family protein [Prevotella sp.]
MNKTICIALLIPFFACTNGNNGQSETAGGDGQDNDSTLYGICGEATGMHSLQLITNTSDTLIISIIDGEEDDSTIVAGGLMAGDRMAVTARKDGSQGLVGQRITNITTLLGRWKSIDRDFEIAEDGVVVSNVKGETNAWTDWRILNGHLILTRDTFDIIALSADSLDIENERGIYSFARVTKVKPVEETDSLDAGQ